MKTRVPPGVLALLAVLLLGAPAGAQEGPRATPRKTVHGYLLAARGGDFADAAQFLDLSRIPETERAAQGPQLARELKIVLDQTLWVDHESLSNSPEGNTKDGLPPLHDSLGKVTTSRGEVPILLERRGDEWLFSAATVSLIPKLYEEHGYGELGQLLPQPMFEIQLLDVQLWQWIALLTLAFVAWLASWALASLGLRLVQPVVKRSQSEFDDELLEALVGPARLVLFVFLFTLSCKPLGLAVPVQQELADLQKAAAAIAVTWLLMRLADLFSDSLARRLNGSRRVGQFVPLGRKVVKVVLVALAVLATLQSFGFNVTALIAGLGVGGIAVALASQKTLENLFGGVTVLADRPVEVGDFCRFGDKIGTVEDIGLRSTRIRTLNRTVISVPNAEFATMQLENFARRDRVWLNPVLGLRYETTPEQMRRVLEAIRDVLKQHPRVLPDGLRARFIHFNAYSLDLEVFAYVDTRDWAEFLAIQEDIYLKFMDVVEACGTGFAFPSQTTYVARDDGIAGLPPPKEPS